MRKINIIASITILFLLMSCNEESLVEGRIPTKPTIVEINQEVLKGASKVIEINIDGVNYSITVNYSYQLSGNTEVRQVSMNSIGISNYVAFNSKGGHIGIVDYGNEINSLFSGAQYTYVGMFLYSINQAGTTNFSYYTINNVVMNTPYYIPFKTVQQSTVQNQTPIYGWISAEVRPDKMILYKCVYNKNGTIKAGEE